MSAGESAGGRRFGDHDQRLSAARGSISAISSARTPPLALAFRLPDRPTFSGLAALAALAASARSALAVVYG